MKILPQELLKILFRYDPKTGLLHWRIPSKKGYSVAGRRDGQRLRKSQDVSIYVSIAGVSYAVHNLIWVYMTGGKPKNEVDHKNRCADDNRWENLREATRSQNQANTGIYKNNATGYRGVHFVPAMNSYRAFISLDGKNKHLGYFDDPDEAYEVWKAAAVEQHGEFASV